MTTARDLIGDALQSIGVIRMGGAMSANMAAHGLRELNRVIDEWRAKNLYLYAITNVSATFAGSSAAVGSGQTVNTAAPLRFLDQCYYIKSGTSYPLPLWTAPQYHAISSKTEAGEYPKGFYFNAAIPGIVYVWPVPSSAVEYHFIVMSKLAEFADTTTDYSLPDGYAAALHAELCVRLPASYGLPVNQQHVQASISSRNAIKRNNTKPVLLSALPDRGTRPNIISD